MGKQVAHQQVFLDVTLRVNGQVLPDIQKDGRTLIFLHHYIPSKCLEIY